MMKNIGSLAYRVTITVILVLALTLIFWQARLFEKLPFASLKLCLLCVCAVLTLIAVPPATRKLSSPASVGVFAITVFFDAACIIITCLKSEIFWVPVIAASAVYAVLMLSFLLFYKKA